MKSGDPVWIDGKKEGILVLDGERLKQVQHPDGQEFWYLSYRVKESQVHSKPSVRRPRGWSPNCNPLGENLLDESFLIPKYSLVAGKVRKDMSGLLPKKEWCVVPYCRWGDGANPRMRRIAAMWKIFPEEKHELGFKHGKQRGVYFHPSVEPNQRQKVIQDWYDRWGYPRYYRLKNQTPPYQTGLEGRPA